MSDPLVVVWSPEQVAVMNQLHDWAVSYQELDQHLGSWMRLPTSDADALSQVVWAAEAGAPLSPAELSRRIGMTSGATTVLLNRLEAAGHVRRSRESTDRRRVTLRPTPSAREATRRFLAFAGVEVAETLQQADAEELRTVTALLARLTVASTRANERLRGHRRSGAERTPYGGATEHGHVTAGGRCPPHGH